MKNALLIAVLSAVSLSALAVEIDPRDVLDRAKNVQDCKEYADLVAQAVTQADDFSFNGRPARARAMRNCKQVLAERDTPIHTAGK